MSAAGSRIHSPIKENFRDFNNHAAAASGLRTSDNAVFIAAGSTIAEGNKIAVTFLLARESCV
jgi:hypothetical protein